MATLLAASCICPFVDADPTAGVTNGGVVSFQGDQSAGVNFQVSDSGPATIVVSNLSSTIAPASAFVPGVQLVGTDTNRNLTAIINGDVSIATSGFMDSYGVLAENSGGSAGGYTPPPTNFVISSQLVGGTNYVLVGSYTLPPDTSTTAFRTNNGVYTVVTTTNVSGTFDTGPGGLVPSGGVTVINRGNIDTTGIFSHGIFAESLPGTISLPGQINPAPYGNGGPVSVFNSGHIGTLGFGADGIFAQSIGGDGPENSPISGNGVSVSVTTGGGAITTSGDSSDGIYAQSKGGNNVGGESGGSGGDGNSGGAGGDGGNVSVTGFGAITNYANNSSGIFALSQAGNGGNGGNGGTFYGSGGSGGTGGKGGDVVVSGSWNIETFGTNSSGISAQSLGGRGGSGGDGSHFVDLGGGNGGGTGDGGTVTVISDGNIHTHGTNSLGIFARSLGGFAGSGGNSYNPFYGNAGDGNSAGAGRDVLVANGGNITTEKDQSQAIYAESVGGGGGGAGSGDALVTLGSSGGAGGNAGNVTVTNAGTLLTFGAGSHGIEAQSIGGGGGDGGDAGGLVALGGSGDTASTGLVVRVENTGVISTFGSNSYAILAQSIGGGGGNAGSSSGAAALGASGGGGGDGGEVHVSNTAALQATGQASMGIFAQSLGGGGGNGGDSGGVVPIGGSGGTASQGSVVTVFNSGSIVSSANAIFAQCIGGGGGNGGSSAGWFPIGGSGAGGGNGAAVTVNNLGALQTSEFNSSAMLVQSVGGGGGNGGSSIGAGVFASLAIGGNGGAGGSGGDVVATSGSNSIVTLGDNSYGIDAESVGGGGGNGGYAIAASIGKGISASVAIGGHAGGGGNAGSVTVASDSAINTSGTNSHGIFAQSIGGGGGAGGFAVSFAGGSDSAIALAMGGDGGGGGNGGIVNVTNTGAIQTSGTHAYGILAQSVGGGGGDGGFAIAGAVAPKNGVSAALAFGGSGSTGGVAQAVGLINVGNITTMGDDSGAVLAQSVGGGGGSGGFSIAGAAAGGSLSASFGGKGAGAGQADTVSLFNGGNLTTFGDRSDGILAQSVGGGGGNGGFAIAGSLSKSGALSLGFGGDSGFGASGGNVTVTNTGVIITGGNDSRGILAQSVGGGGGNGGFSLAGSISQGNESVSAALSFGGNASTGGVASAVSVANFASIETFGTNADAILAQSVGGGGGAGGFAGAGAFSPGSNSTQVAVSFGGQGGAGNFAGMVTVSNTAQLVTHGNDSIGILAQSVGGGGGSGGMAVAGTFSESASQNASLSLGGNGGAGGDASAVNVDASGDIFTSGDRAHGILAQSVGGGGGNGGLAVAVDFGLGNPGDVNQYAVAIGGSGNDGGRGGNVFLGGSNLIVTAGQDAYGVFAQSVGGGGGSGGFSLAVTGVLGANQGTNRALTLAVGGGGGEGNIGGSVLVNRSGDIETLGDGSYGIVAQSIGGGGGDGGGARSMSLFTRGGGSSGNGGDKQESKSESLNISVGGNGGNGSYGGEVTLTNSGDIITHGADAYGIFAESVGGGGGSGGNAHSSTDDLIPVPIPGLDDVINKAFSVDADSLQIVVGGNGGSNGFGSHVIVNDTGAISTFGDGSYGIFAQSVGGGGGVAGNGTIGKDGQIGIGGGGGSSGDGGQVDVIHSGSILTTGAGSAGIFAQSVGGGGGVAGNIDRGLKDAGINVGDGFAFGRDGGSAGNGSAVNVLNVGDITTGGTGAYGIFAQSVGGGGGLVGNLGNNVPVLSSITDFAGSVGHSGSGGDVTVSENGNIATYGTNSTGIFAQSAGGTNGVGGNVTVTLNGSVRAYGVDADGILAQSGGGATVVTPPIPVAPSVVPRDTLANGDVTVTIGTNGVVQGGTGNGVGIRFLDGVNNSLVNYGVVTSVGNLTGMAVSGTGGNDRVDNYGQIVGSVDLGSGGNVLNNRAGGTMFAGSTLNVGAGNTLANSGTISLGDANNMQVAALNGNLLQDANGSLQVKLASATVYDALNSSGSAMLDGNLSVFRFNNYLPLKGDTFTVLSATNITGQFASLSDPYAGNYALRLETLYTPTNVSLQVVQDSFLQFTHTRNQKAVSKNLNSLSGAGTTGGDPRAASLVAFLDTQDASQLPQDLDLISPDELGSMFDLTFAAINQQSQNLHQRMSDIRAGDRWGSGSLSSFDSHGPYVQIASAGHELPHISDATQDDKGWGVFAAGNGQYVEVNGSTNGAGYHFDSEGVTLGLDKMLSDNFGLGFTLDYASTKASLVQNGNVNVDGGRGGVYATWFNTNSYLESSIGGGYNHYSTKRAALGGFATGGPDGFNVDALMGGGYDFRCNHFAFGPQANLHYTYVRVNEFTEKGSMAPLHLENNDSSSLLTQVGIHAAYEWQLHQIRVRPEAAMAWQHEALDATRALDSRLASGAGSIFTVHSPAFGRDSLSVDVGLTVRWTRSISTFLAYHGDYLRQDYTSQSGSGGIIVTF